MNTILKSAIIKQVKLSIVLAMALCLTPFLHAKSGPDINPIKDKALLFQIQSKKNKIEVYSNEITPITKFQTNKVTTLLVKIVGNSKGQYSLSFFDARMPEHDHGMMTKPVITKLSVAGSEYQNIFKVSGVNLHMKGKWRFYFRAVELKSKKKLFFKYDLDL